MKLLLLSALAFGATLSPVTATQSAVPHVVKIVIADPRGTTVSESMGFVVEKEGFLLTAYDPLSDRKTGRLHGEDIKVTTFDGENAGTYPASIIGLEPTLNLGVLKIESDREFRPSVVRRQSAQVLGLEIRAPVKLAGETPETTVGRISALNTRECYQESLTSTMFRAEIGIPETSIGAPIYGTDGEVLAIYTAHKPTPAEGHVEDPDETHLLPVFLAFNIYDSIKQKKSLRSPWTGFSVRSLTEAEQGYFPASKGHLGGIGIEHIWENSPAERMGVRMGDVLVQFSHNRITSVAEFQKWLYMYGVGHRVKLVFLRDGRDYLVADYEIEERPDWATPR